MGHLINVSQIGSITNIPFSLCYTEMFVLYIVSQLKWRKSRQNNKKLRRKYRNGEKLRSRTQGSFLNDVTHIWAFLIPTLPPFVGLGLSIKLTWSEPGQINKNCAQWVLLLTTEKINIIIITIFFHNYYNFTILRASINILTDKTLIKFCFKNQCKWSFKCFHIKIVQANPLAAVHCSWWLAKGAQVPTKRDNNKVQISNDSRIWMFGIGMVTTQ